MQDEKMRKGSLVDDVASVRELASKQGSMRGALSLLREFGVPVHAGLFSRRLFLARLERPRGTATDIWASFAERLSALGLVVVEMRRGRRTRAQLRAARSLRIGLPEVAPEEESAYAPLLLREGQTITAGLHAVAKRDASGVGAFNITGFDLPDAPDLYLMYIASEDRVLEVQRRELVDLRANLTSKDTRKKMVSAWRGDGIRISIRRGDTDFEAALRVRDLEDGRDGAAQDGIDEKGR